MHAKPLLIAVVLLSYSLEASASPAPSYQQGAKLVGTGAVGNAGQGLSVSLSADGNTAILGGYSDNGGAGAAWVYSRSGGVWSQQGAKLVGTGAVGSSVFQGWSVSLSADGNTAIVGAYSDNSFAGAAWVFTRNGSIWTQQGAKLVGTGAVGTQAEQGYSVSLSADGNTAVVGGPGDGTTGAAWVWTRTGAVWSQLVKLVGTGAVGDASQGYSVSVSPDGNTIIAGGPGDNGTAGAAWVYTRSGGQQAKLVGTGAVGNALQGYSVALSGDGNTAIVGGYEDNGFAGAAWVYTRSGSVWTQQGAKLVGTGAVGNADQGRTVALSADGNTAIVGGYADNTGAPGAAWVYTRSAGAWSQQGAKRVGTGAVGTAYEGLSVALSGDGYTAIVGGYDDNSGAGAAWVFIDPAPAITSVHDVPNDQGGHVNLRWTASLLDNEPYNPMDAYWIWRQVPNSTALSALPADATLPSDGAVVESPTGRKFRVTRDAAQVYYWEYVASQVADGYPAYSYTAPTSGDSIAGSNPLTYFMVEAKQLSSGGRWPSDPDSGYSVDNLPPGAPAIIAAAYQTGATHLHWAPNTEPDFSLYRLYRGNSSAFVPSTGNLIAAQPDTGYADTGPAGSYYKISAVDIHGNESAFSLFSPATNTGVSGGGAVAFALDGVWPNPARSTGLNVAFALASDAAARLELLDMSGRRVAMQEVGALGAGRHAVNLAQGHRVAPGLYWVRLTQGANQRVTRAAVLE